MYRLKARLPDVPVAINGGIADIATVQAQLDHVDGVMLGRAAYHQPELLLEVDPVLFGEPAPRADAFAAVAAFEPYVARHVEQGGRLHDVTRHMLGLFTGQPGARAFRRRLAIEGVKAGGRIGRAARGGERGAPRAGAPAGGGVRALCCCILRGRFAAPQHEVVL